MTRSPDTTRLYVSAQIALVVVSAMSVGLVDAASVMTGISGATGAIQYTPARLWILSPVVWLFVAALPAAVLIAAMRKWGAVVVASGLGIVFLAIRLRGHLALVPV